MQVLVFPEVSEVRISKQVKEMTMQMTCSTSCSVCASMQKIRGDTAYML